MNLHNVQEAPDSNIEQFIPLADRTWFKTGGSARFFSAPTSVHEFQQAIMFAQSYTIPVFVLGEGANILISDQGFDGLVIRPALKNIHHKQVDGAVLVTVGAGTSMPDLIEYCLHHEIIGLEEFSGIPGTVGGSVYINLHYFEFLLDQFLLSAQVIHRTTGQVLTVDTSWFNFGYNRSRLLAQDYYLLEATFLLKPATPLQVMYARGRRTEIIRHRERRYPTQGTCGSFFRNFHEDEVTLELNGKKMLFVAYYLDKLGIKGSLSVGGARVSHQHANMLVNTGTATSTDIIALARTMQSMVYDAYGIIPQPECQLVGFKTYPLLKKSSNV
jgi:UDP-N-acetylmuramate dehydrogenase